MIVPITVKPSNTTSSAKLPPCVAKLGHDELFLIELQGTLDVQCPESSTKDGQLIGKLNVVDMVGTWTPWLVDDDVTMRVAPQNKPTLAIGHHLLEGKVVNLTKPLGVLHKHVSGPPSHEGEKGTEMEIDEGDGTTGRQCSDEVRWDVTAVVKKKIVFSKRPMPVPITKPASHGAASRNWVV